MGDPIGPNGTSYEFQIGRWFHDTRKVNLDVFLTARDPELVVPHRNTETSEGFAIETFQSPNPIPGINSLGELRALAAFEWVHDLNTIPGNNSFRVAVQLTGAINPHFSFAWH
jgi:hypothetical protein